MNESVAHTDVAAYALGLLTAEDARAFEAHLAGCDSCAAELAGLGGMAGLLRAARDDAGGDPGEVPAEPGAAGPGNVIGFLRARNEAERRRSRHRWLVAAAMAVLLPVGGGVVGSALSTPDPASHHGTASPARDLLGRGDRFTAPASPAGVGMTVALEDKAWGTHIGLRLTGVRGPLTCSLIAVDRAGREQTITNWRVPEKGYGVPGGPEPLYVHGGAALSRPDLAALRVRTTDGRTLNAITF
ncbi:anti-sigma factor family protein [Bailinhaonella thermotolerans]|uniref:Putative zinc-finger domain-containing protein n=1 Tax=Bailinhaonella thermotolerans TaxID=1070861 RepID=A0A3A4B2D0_9ACTN|nr:zf-HC2 domain-containing protein [Bailinhaonella thermotolerans]RJL34328.1 hypothetical protein D5H75_07730 [Bailinhaonella thermotolerans]